MLNLDTLHTARLIQERTNPERLERTRILRQAQEGMPRNRPKMIVLLGRLVTRTGTWLQGRPQIRLPESICSECRQPLPGTPS